MLSPGNLSEALKIDPIDSALLDLLRTTFSVVITDDRGVILDANEQFCANCQYSPSELIGKTHAILKSGVHPNSFFAEIWEHLQTGKPWRGEICNRAKDGSRYWVQCVIAQLGSASRYISIELSTTEVHQQETLFRQQQSLMKRIERAAGVGGWELDLASNKLVWTDETCRIHALEPGYQPNLDTAINFYAPEARAIVEAAVKKGLETGQSWDLELPLIRADGKRIWVRAVGYVDFDGLSPSRLYGAFQDITERIEQRDQLKELYQRSKLATESGRIGIWEHNLETGVLKWDDTTYKIYGLQPSGEVESYELWSKQVHPDDLTKAEEEIAAALEGKTKFDTEFRVIWPDGSVHNIRGTAQVRRNESGEPIKMVGVNWDVTEHRNMEQQLSNQRELLEVTLHSIGDAVITTDQHGKTVWLNPIAEQLTGWDRQDAEGKPISRVFDLRSEEGKQCLLLPKPTELKDREFEGFSTNAFLISKSGDAYGIEESVSAIKDPDGEVRGLVLTFRDVTEKRRLAKEVQYRVSHDDLTGLMNRFEFDRRLVALLDNCAEAAAQHAMLYIDLDQFKIINDTCGHSAGDDLLKNVAKILSKAVRSHDALARLGGDEFGVILENCDVQQASRAANKICELLEDYRFQYQDHRFRVSASIGLAPIDAQTHSVNALMQAADTAMYAAKEAGRNRVHIWSGDDSATTRNQGEMQWVTRIERALDEDLFQLYAQRLTPLAQNQEGSSSGLHLEILLRMNDADGAVVSPGLFYPVAERFSLASRIDRWVFRAVLDWLKDGSNLQCLDKLCVNLSGQSVGDPNFHQYATQLLSDAGPDICSKLCIEITETAAITNIADASSFIQIMHDMGIRIALDDFGAGASSFGYLKNLAVDILKIDGQFIRDVITDPLDAAAVRCFVDVAKTLGLETVAEFVDKPEVLERITELGVDYAQGFLLHMPEPIDRACRPEG